MARRCPAALERSASIVVSMLLGCSRPPPEAPSSARLGAPAIERRSVASDRESVSLTVYNSGVALVREQRRVALGAGRVALAYLDVSAHIQPETVHLRSLEAPDALAIVEQNYRHDLLTPAALLEASVGAQVRVVRRQEPSGADVIEEAELLSAQGEPVLRIDGEVVTGGVQRFIFEAVPPSLLERPTLVWLLDSQRERQRVELSYLTAQLSWQADYVLVLDEGRRSGDLGGWVTLENRSGASYADAELKLVAGDVQRVEPASPPAPLAEMDAAESVAAGAGFAQEALFEYHLYTLGRRTDVLDQEQKQVRLLDARGVPVEKRLLLRGPGFGLRAPLRGTPGPENARVLLALDNVESAGLGAPLPAGTVRVYASDAGGSLQLVGQDAIEHTPRDEHLELELGEAFDVVGARRQLSFRALGRCAAESDWELRIHNHGQAGVVVEAREAPGLGHELRRSSHPAVDADAQGYSFEVEVPARGEVVVTWQVRLRWC